MSDRTVRLSREELHELVWSRPMTEIAAEFGMSSVAFAKYCKGLDVPCPGRGYWQQLAAGQKPKRTKLPKARDGIAPSVVIEKYDRPRLGRRPSGASVVAVPERIARYHSVAKEILDRARKDIHYQRMFAIRGERDVVLKFGEPSRDRVARLLHTLFVAVEERGHVVRFSKKRDASYWAGERWALEIVIDGDPIELTLREHLVRKEHEKTPIERRIEWLGRKYDLEPSGTLILELRIPWGSETRTRWRDGKRGQLEDFLGEIVWTIDGAARGLVTHRLRVAEQKRLAEIARREAEAREEERKRREAVEREKRRQEERLAAHRQALHDDLFRMAHDARAIEVVRAFLQSLSRAVPAADRNPEFTAWFAWATTHVEELDPLRDPTKLAKPLLPT